MPLSFPCDECHNQLVNRFAINVRVGKRAILTTNQAANAPHFRYHQTMTIGIAGPGRRTPGQNALVRLIAVALVGGISLIVLGLASDFLVDWLWFSSIGYLPVFLISIGTKALLFFSVLTATAVTLWLNGWLAVRFAQQQRAQVVAASAWNPTASTLPPNLFALMRDRLPWSRVVAGGAGLLAHGGVHYLSLYAVRPAVF